MIMSTDTGTGAGLTASFPALLAVLAVAATVIVLLFLLLKWSRNRDPLPNIPLSLPEHKNCVVGHLDLVQARGVSVAQINQSALL